jgi:DNA modification methylase
MTWRIETGDCLDVLAALSPKSVAAVITDPPYGINTKSDGSGKLNPWADLMNAAYWYREWFGLVRRALRDDGCMWCCINWRGLPTIQKASADLGWPVDSLLVWDKGWIGPTMRGLRPSYELVALFGGPNFQVADRSIPDVQRFKWSSIKPSGHPAEKPEALFDFALSHSPSGLVVDPFAGSGTSGVCAVRSGRDYVGVEIDEKWADSARVRIGEAHRAQQTALQL